MNQIKRDTEVTLADLRALGRQGGVTARLIDGSIVTLHPQFGTMLRKGYIAGRLEEVEVVYDYPGLYSQIRTILSNGVLVARREGIGNRSVLRLTGKGYKRKE
ncbi:hypothetical protein [Streptococcus acidominimus]|uniref:Uncharacterized protein n=1 Tax=Streptococcus acidominimus TaxID=1326 RepID=A0A1Q8EEH4_STRAI|nr:hypothetical protein [Streptococcus acidominimus]OLF50186.1 hypothetical protein BU200_03310 [Streptococcus acidominimus]SUN08394.1 Uncharacterised protein [Streptococcus acidominimus]